MTNLKIMGISISYSPLITLTFLITLFTNCYSQYIPIPINQKVEQSDLIIEGKVIGQKTFIGLDDEVYTENKILISQVLKGNENQLEVSVITWGGKFEDYEINWTHLATLNINQYVVLFLKPSKIIRKQETQNTTVFYDIFSSAQGLYHLLLKDSNQGLMAKSVVESYENANDLYFHIKESAKPKLNYFGEVKNATDVCISYLFKPIETTGLRGNTPISFELLMRVESGDYDFYKGNVKVKYNTEIFGENIVASSDLTYIKGDLDPVIYNFEIFDISNDEFEILLEANTVDNNQLFDLGTDYVKIATLTFNINQWSEDKPFDLSSNEGIENYYIEQGSGLIKEFDCTKVWLDACDIDITGFTPKIAAAGVSLQSFQGVDGTVIITGSGFSTPLDGDPKPDDYRVKFKTIDGKWIAPLEGDYISWTDTRIEVKVPSIGYVDDSDNVISDFNTQIACTGKIKVCEDTRVVGIRCPCCCNDTSREELYIPFSARNTLQTNSSGFKESIRTVLRGFNNNDGYTIFFKSNFSSNAGAVDAFKRALTTWRCATRVNFDITQNSFTSAAPGNCLVEFSSLPVGTMSATRGTTSYSPVNCGTEPNIDFSHLSDFLMRFNSNIDWHTGTNMPNNLNWNNTTLGKLEADMQSTALHELGHAHLLLHTCNEENVMLHPGVDGFRRDLDGDDKSGGDHISLISSSLAPANCPSEEMALIDLMDCNITPTIEIGNQLINVDCFPNPAKEILHIKFSHSKFYGGKILLIDSFGKVVFEKPCDKNETEVSMENIPIGTYFVVYRTDDGSDSFLEKIIKI